MNLLRFFSLSKSVELKRWLLPFICVMLVSMATRAQVPSTNGNFTATTPSNLSLQTGATPTTRLTILNSNGNIGINTTSPADWLHVNGNVRANQFNTVNGIFNTTAAATNMSFNINGTNRMTLLSGGNFGIGTATPADLLHVNGSARANQFNTVNGIFNTTAAATNMSFSTNGVNRMTLLSGGNFGIGTATPADLLHVNGSARANQFNTVNGIFNTTAAATNMSFNTNGVNRMTLLSGGNFGIGTATPADLLHVNGNARATQFSSTSGTFNTIGATNLSLGTNGTTKMTLLNSNGFLGINTATPAYQLDVNGTVNATGFLLNGAAFTGSQWTAATGGINYNGGSVGMGTTTPSAKLHIVFPGSGDPSNQAIQVEATNPANYSSTMFKNSSGDIGVIGFTGASYNWGMHLPRQAFISSSTPNGIALVSYDPNGIITFGTGGHATTNERVRIDKLGNVGIGKTNPAYPLDVAGAINATNIFTSGNVGIGTTSPEGLLHIGTSNLGVGTAKRLLLEPPYHTGAAWQFTVRDDTGSSYLGIGYGTESLTMHHGGNVGIGTNTPNYKLDVAGTINATSILVNGAPLTGGGSSQWATNGSNISYAAGNVGIGIASPSEKLEVNGNLSVGLNAGAATGYGNRLNLRGVDDAASGDPMWLARYNTAANQTELRVNIGDDSSGDDAFTVGNFFHGDGQWKTFLKVINNGNVGIGITNPTQKLQVKGTVYSTEVKVDLAAGTGPDYVFEPTYDLKPLAEIETYIKENKHLPEVPSAKEMEKNGVQLGEMNMLLLKKIEELTLYILDQNKELEKLKERSVSTDSSGKKVEELTLYVISQQNKIKEQELRLEILEKRFEK